MGLGPVFLLAAMAATDDAPNAARLIDQLAACRGLTEDAQRLACFDRTAGAVVEARARKDIIVLDKAEVRRTKRSLFGFSLPSIKLFGDGKDDEQLTTLTGTIRNALTLTGGNLRFELDEGGVWETTETATVMPRKGDVVTIKAGSLGRYVATAPKRRAVRVRRIR